MIELRARFVEVGHYVEFRSSAGKAPIGFDNDKPYQVKGIDYNGVTPRKFRIHNRSGYLDTVHSSLVDPSDFPD